MRHRYVHGGFRGTETRFSIYLPPEASYQGRFFQHITPVPDSEHLAQHQGPGEQNKIGFSLASGAYFLETNGGGVFGGYGADDPTIAAYRANAAAAQYSRVVASAMYGPHRPYGYAYGGSGGGFRTIGSIENTTGVWDGVVPYVIGSPMAIPNMFTVRMHASGSCATGSSASSTRSNPAGVAIRSRASRQRNATPCARSRAWASPALVVRVAHHGHARLPRPLRGHAGGRSTYFEEFWTEPGYLGHDAPPSLRPTA